QPHEFIIRYVDHGSVRGLPYVVTEYLESANLKELYNRKDDLLSEFIGNILIDSAIALMHMHDRGFMHLDFKPENVLVTRNGNVRLIDFDLSLPIEGKPVKMSNIPGTPAYMAPEQLARKPFDHRADMFAYGVAAYELLTYKKPFPAETGPEVLRLQTTRNSFLSPREHNADIPAALEKIILKCLENEPTQRYQDMSFLVRDLETVLYVK
ncbi:MAG: serine/threonine-protein kinase, partial [Verrucomicrobiota bacterium]